MWAYTSSSKCDIQVKKEEGEGRRKREREITQRANEYGGARGERENKHFGMKNNFCF